MGSMGLRDTLQQLASRSEVSRAERVQEETSAAEVAERDALASAPAEVRPEVRYGGDGRYVPAVIPLELIEIDAEQPRGYLPPALRGKVARGELKPSEALAALVQQAQQGERTAQGYLASISELAESMSQEGQLEPVGVTQLEEGRYRLIWGERRYWAAWWLRARGAWGDGLACRVRVDELEARVLRRAQWAENMQREEVPLVRLAELVAEVYQEVRQEVGGDQQRLAERVIEVVRERTGKVIARSTMYFCLQIGGALCDEARELAAAWRFSWRELGKLARLSGEQQVAVARLIASQRMKGEDGRGEEKDKRGQALRRVGRKAARWKKWAEGVKRVCEAERLERLAKLSEAELREIEAAVMQALQAVNEQLDKVRRALWETAK